MNGCTIQQSITVTLGRPTITITGNTTVCPGSSLTLSVNGNLSYNWSNGSSGNSAVFIPTASTVYTVIKTNTKGCTNTASILVTTPLQIPNTLFSYQTPCAKVAPHLLLLQHKILFQA